MADGTAEDVLKNVERQQRDEASSAARQEMVDDSEVDLLQLVASRIQQGKSNETDSGVRAEDENKKKKENAKLGANEQRTEENRVDPELDILKVVAARIHGTEAAVGAVASDEDQDNKIESHESASGCEGATNVGTSSKTPTNGTCAVGIDADDDAEGGNVNMGPGHNEEMVPATPALRHGERLPISRPGAFSYSSSSLQSEAHEVISGPGSMTPENYTRNETPEEVPVLFQLPSQYQMINALITCRRLKNLETMSRLTPKPGNPGLKVVLLPQH
ncbi:expressed unknown protein [Seminavis robusta]|uniref:Uncharacterized protein n=1 Tax=Seminavis robusta TaxID=568900 RepID=A0A9N8HWE6_9STRA|nr:expressed unknown protein [Seminavis robusta]|eukprot:Sro2196_g318590.1 n/a (275) ;mRNA; f:5496-6320